MNLPSWLKGRFVLPLILAGGFVVLFPNLRREDVSFVLELPPRGCASFAIVEVTKKDELLRSFKIKIGNEPELSHQIPLARGEYLVKAALWCEATDRTESRLQPVVVDGPGAVPLDLGAWCPCRDTD